MAAPHVPLSARTMAAFSALAAASWALWIIAPVPGQSLTDRWLGSSSATLLAAFVLLASLGQVLAVKYKRVWALRITCGLIGMFWFFVSTVWILSAPEQSVAAVYLIQAIACVWVQSRILRL